MAELDQYDVVAFENGRELRVDWDSKVTCEGEEGFLLKAAIVIVATGDTREQTIFGPNLLARRLATIARRLRDWDEGDLTPQRVTG